MYSNRGFRESEIGDIDVIRIGDTYHLFHLILPNHDYIAHATSTDCINWTRVKSALFVGDPGEWDDDMLWTMNVSRARDGGFEMFYTGLSQKEKGRIQRIGKAVSPDLVHWEKVNAPPFPISPAGPYYESKTDNPRHWVSFRDPFLFRSDGNDYLLVCARVNRGAVSRRGCVGVVRLEDDQARIEGPLFTPFVYDDVECPCLVELDNRFYLIGSIREDVKVHYWYAHDFQGEYHAFHDNVLMPQGNYAARVTRDGDHVLIHAFYIADHDTEHERRYLPPPQELRVRNNGRLELVSYHRWDEKINESIEQSHFPDFLPVFCNPSAEHDRDGEMPRFASASGYELFSFRLDDSNYIWSGQLRVLGRGKCGLYFDGDDKGNGYYISLDVVHGYVQIRRWGDNPEDIMKDYVFQNLQTNMFAPNEKLTHTFKLIRYGHYIEFSLDGVVRLALIDGAFNGGHLGFYCESAEISLSDGRLDRLEQLPGDAEELSCLVPDEEQPLGGGHA